MKRPQTERIVSLAAVFVAMSLAVPVTVALASEGPLPANIPVPKPRPEAVNARAPADINDLLSANKTRQIAQASASVSPKSGTLDAAITALEEGRVAEALAMRAGMVPGSLDRKVLAWVLAISGDLAVPSSEVQKISRDLANWPSQKQMANNLERAIVRENPAPGALLSRFSGTSPKTLTAASALAEAYYHSGQKQKARSVIVPFWHNEKLTNTSEKRLLEQFGNVLTRDDHRRRMHKLFYQDRAKAGLAMASLAEQSSLAKARASAIRQDGKADARLQSVAASSKADAGFLFARIENARRKERFDEAHALLLRAPSDPKTLVDPDEWWVERRIVSRILLEQGDPRSAYDLVDRTVGGSSAAQVDKEFHAGWYALRYLKQKRLAQKHFLKLVSLATIPTSISRGHYWMGRASRGSKARSHFKQAAKYSGTYYGQLALLALKKTRLPVARTRAGATDRSNFAKREQVRALVRLEQLGHKSWAGRFYRHLARTLSSSGELALLAARAEKQGNHNLALQVGMIAHKRGLKVDTLNWPLGAIPATNRLLSNDKALAYAVSRRESAFNKAAVSPANARGMMQLLPDTAKLMARKTGQQYSFKGLTQDAAYNVTLGTAYLDEQLERFGGSYIMAIAAYNAGPARVDEWVGRFGDPRGKSLEHVIDWVEKIPYTETRNYVQRVMESYQVYKARIIGPRLELAKDLVIGRR